MTEYHSIKELLALCDELNKNVWEVVLQADMDESGMSEEEVFEKMRFMYQAMREADAGYEADLKSQSGMVGGDGEKMRRFNASGKNLCSEYSSLAMEKALKMGESNACMKRIVAAPTAGSCGVIPAILLSYEENKNAEEDELVKALFISAGIGKVVAENASIAGAFGGGICQVSTTLYNAVLRAELKVTERSNHSMTVHYVPLSADAAISGTDKDLKFTNNLDHPVYIQGVAGGSSITFTIYGKEYRAKNRKVEYESETVSTRGPSEKVIKDNTMEEGKRVVESSGRTGYTARLWKVVYIDGKETKRTQVNSSSYMSTPSVVRVGTKKKVVPKPTTEKGKETTKAGDKPGSDTGAAGNNNSNNKGTDKAE